jgi:hypothetical protein
LRQSGTGEFNEQITKLVHAYEQTATSMNIRHSFRNGGIYPTIGSRPYEIRFDEERLRNNPGFKELWQQNVPIVDLSQRRILYRFGVINSEFRVD